MQEQPQDVVGECISSDHGDLAFDVCAKVNVWQNYYSRVLNEELEWDKDALSSDDSIPSSAVRITREWVKKTISKMKSGKAVGGHQV